VSIRPFGDTSGMTLAFPLLLSSQTLCPCSDGGIDMANPSGGTFHYTPEKLNEPD